MKPRNRSARAKQNLHANPESFFLELNQLSREIDAALLMRAGGAALASVAALGLSAAPSLVQAATFTVTTTGDSGAGSLRQAIIDANASAGPDDVVFNSTVTGEIVLTSGDIDVTDPVDITGPGSATLTIDADYASRHLYFSSSATGSSISGLTLTNGDAPGDGGAIYSYAASLSLDDVVLENNYAGEDGGALVVYSDAGDIALTVSDSTFSGNTADSSGGGIYLYVSGDADVNITDSTFSGNTADSGSGGGVNLYLENGNADVTITGSYFIDNSADDAGGGLYFYSTSNVAGTTTLALNGNEFTNNTARKYSIFFDGGVGGGAYIGLNLNSSTAQFGATIASNIFAGNTATDDGGGIYLNVSPDAGAGSVSLTGNEITDNQSGADGGGLYLDFNVDALAGGSANVNLTDTLITGNVAGLMTVGIDNYYTGGNGGGMIANVSSGVQLTLNGGEISNNTAHPYKDKYGIQVSSISKQQGKPLAGTKGRPSPGGCGGPGGNGGGLAICQNEDGEISLNNITLNANQALRGQTPDVPPYYEAYFGGLGGGVFATQGYGGAVLDMTALTLDQNYAQYAGGGIAIIAGTIFGVPGPVNSKRAWKAGDDLMTAGLKGGIAPQNEITLTDSTISGNTESADPNGFNGGGLFIYSDSTSISLTNSTLSGNTGNLVGAGSVYQAGDAPVRINHLTVADNTGDYVGGLFLYGYGNFSVYNSAFAGNAGAASYADALYADTSPNVNVAYSVFEGSVGGTLSDQGGNIYATDPQLGPLQNNGGPTLTHAIDTASPAFNAGDLNFTPPPDTDQRGAGFARVVFGQTDMGSFEFQGPIAVTLEIAPDPANLPEDGSTSATISACLPAGVTVLEDVQVTLSVSGSATPGADHDLADGTVITIPTNSQCGDVTITAVQDSENEVDSEMAIVDIDTLTQGYLEGNPNQVTATIADDEVGPPPGPQVAVVSLGVSVNTLTEGDTTTLSATLDDPAPGDVTISVGFSGQAQAGTDFTVAPNPILIAQGDTTGSAQITAIDDTDIEGDEPFTATVQAATCTPNCSVTIPSPPPQANGTIIDNDQAQEEVTPIPALGPIGLLLLPFLIPIAGWRYWRRRFSNL